MEDWRLLDACPWVLQARLQEQYGNTEAARAAYEHARKLVTDDDDAVWAVKLIPASAR